MVLGVNQDQDDFGESLEHGGTPRKLSRHWNFSALFDGIVFVGDFYCGNSNTVHRNSWLVKRVESEPDGGSVGVPVLQLVMQNRRGPSIEAEIVIGKLFTFSKRQDIVNVTRVVLVQISPAPLAIRTCSDATWLSTDHEIRATRYGTFGTSIRKVVDVSIPNPVLWRV